MRSRILLNLALLALVAALGAYLVHDLGRAPEGEPRRLTDLDPGAVTRIAVSPAGGPGFELARAGSDWRLVAPRELPADAVRVQALLGVLAAESRAGFRAAGNDLARFGLAPPLVRLEVDGRALAFGGTEAIDGHRYVLHDGEVHLVADAQYHHLSARAENFVHPAPLGPGADPVELRLAGLTMRRIEGRWQTEPEDEGFGADQRNALAAAWAESRAMRAHAFDPGRRWAYVVQVRPHEGAPLVRIEVAENDHEVVLGRRNLGVQWHFTPSAARSLRLRRAP